MNEHDILDNTVDLECPTIDRICERLELLDKQMEEIDLRFYHVKKSLEQLLHLIDVIYDLIEPHDKETLQ